MALLYYGQDVSGLDPLLPFTTIHHKVNVMDYGFHPTMKHFYPDLF